MTYEYVSGTKNMIEYIKNIYEKYFLIFSSSVIKFVNVSFNKAIIAIYTKLINKLLIYATFEKFFATFGRNLPIIPDKNVFRVYTIP